MNARRWLGAVVTLGLSLSPLAGNASGAPQDASAAQMLPGATFAFASARDAGDLERICLGSPVGARLVRLAGEVRPFLARKLAESEAGAVAGAGSALVRFVRRHAAGEVAAAVLGWKAEPGYRPVPEGAFLVRCRPGAADAAARELASLSAGFSKKVKGLSHSEAKHGTASYHRVGDREVTFAFGAVGDYLVVASSPDAFKAVVDAAAKGRKETLAAHPAFWACRKRVGEKADLLAYVNAVPLWQVGAVYEPKFERSHPIAKALGFDGLEAAAYGLSADAGEFRETVYVYTPTRSGVFQWLETPPVAELPQDLRLVPADAASCAFGMLSLKKAWDAATAAVREIDGAFYAKKIEPGIKAAEQFLGFPIGDGILGALEGEFVTFGGDWRVAAAMPGAEPSVYQETTCILKLKDEVRFRALLGSAVGYLRAFLPLPIQDRKSGNAVISAMGMPAMDGTPFQVEWTVSSGRFILSWGAPRVEEVLSRLAGTGNGSILDVPAFASGMGKLGRKGGHVQYEDVGRALASLAAALQGVVGGKSSDPAIAALIEEVRGAGADLGALVMTSIYEPHGIAFEAVGPFPLSGIAVAGVGAAVAVPALVGVRGGE